MTYQELERMIRQLPDISLLVIGDYFLDRYFLIDPAKDEPSRETGLTAYQIVGRRLSPGAAGTVTNNLKALGVGQVLALGIIGDDGEGLELRRALEATGVDTDSLIVTQERVTPTYTKPLVVEGDQEREINRLDIKNGSATPAHLEAEIIRRLWALAEKVDGIIVLDQVEEADHGVVTAAVRDALAKLGRKHPHLPIYADSRAFTPQFKEIIVKCNHHDAVSSVMPERAGDESEELIRACGLEMAKRTNRPVFVTRGPDGQLIFDGERVQSVPAIRVEGPVDIVGAGDATTAGTVCGLCCGADLADAALLGNLVSSITIQQLGTTGTASPDQVLERFSQVPQG